MTVLTPLAMLGAPGQVAVVLAQEIVELYILIANRVRADRAHPPPDTQQPATTPPTAARKPAP